MGDNIGAATKLGQRIDELRRQHRPPMSQAALSRASGIGQSTISRLRSSDDHAPDVKTLERLAEALSTTVADLARAAYGDLLGTPQPHPEPIPFVLDQLIRAHRDLPPEDWAMLEQMLGTLVTWARARLAGKLR
jgi:transcriptional regulator with XRE-family HTH domain